MVSQVSALALAVAVVLATATIDPVVSVACGIAHASSHTRIVGGHTASPHAYPWIVYIQSELVSELEDEPNLYAACDGSLINDQWIVTAAHCFGPPPNYKINRVALVLGAHNLANKTEHRFVVSPKHILRNGDYVDNTGSYPSKHDITMVQLPQKINFAATGSTVAPICLPADGTSVSKSSCQAIGWGKVGPDAASSPVLKVVDHNMLSSEECQRFRPEVSDLQVCAGVNHQGTCQGDSGGPLQCKNADGAFVLSGIVSYGDKLCGGANPAVFTNVEKFVPWIKRVMADYP